MRYAIDGRYIQDHFPGIGRYTYNLVRHMAPLCSSDTLVVFCGGQARNTHYDIAALGAWPHVVLVDVLLSPFSLRQQWALPNLARRLRLDLYHSPYYVIPYAMPCPVVASLHDLIPWLYPQALPRPWLRWLFGGLAWCTQRRADGLIVDAESTREDVARLWDPSPKSVAIPLAADEMFRPQGQAAVARVRRHLGLSRPYLLYLGINKPHKNLVSLVRAWGGIAPSLRAGHELVLAGAEDPRYPEVRQAVAGLGLQQEVRFLGVVADQDLPGLYGGALGFVFPSLYEGFGLPILEAMACGVPVACSNRSALVEVAGHAALTFDPGKVSSIIEVLTRLLSDADLRRRLSMAGLERAGEYSWSRTARATLDLYQWLAGGAGGS